MTAGVPAVTVLMAVWNPHPRYFLEAVQSVLGQSFRDFELLVVEDPSPRDAAALLAEIDDERIRVVRREARAGLAAALNSGLALARAPLIARMDADDVCVADRLTRQIEFLTQHPEIDVVGSRILIVNEDGRAYGRRLLPLRHEEIAAALRRYNCISHPAVMMRRERLESVGGYDPQQRVEDYDLWCRMLRSGARFANLEQPVVRYRFHPGALKFEHIHEVIRETMAIKRRYFGDAFDFGDRLRLFGEVLLLILPQRLVLWLFTKLQYRRG